jgi:hypothetical protein
MTHYYFLRYNQQRDVLGVKPSLYRIQNGDVHLDVSNFPL